MMQTHKYSVESHFAKVSTKNFHSSSVYVFPLCFTAMYAQYWGLKPCSIGGTPVGAYGSGGGCICCRMYTMG